MGSIDTSQRKAPLKGRFGHGYLEMNRMSARIQQARSLNPVAYVVRISAVLGSAARLASPCAHRASRIKSLNCLL